MALQSRRDELLAAWRALSGEPTIEGWRTIPVAHGGPCRLLAGRHFPGNEEALLVGFPSTGFLHNDQLPQGRGFLVAKATFGEGGPEHAWIALSRQSVGSLELFALMADDIMSTLGRFATADAERLFHIFLRRIQAWQEFMRRGEDCVLNPEAEVGLFGELELLRDLVSSGLPPAVAAEAWQGPLDALQDFVLGTGAIEVKSTVSPASFPATIGSLEQLDNSLTQPLFLAGIRLALGPSGRTLPEQVDELRDLMCEEPIARDVFDGRLIRAGYLDAMAERYSRRFSRTGGKIFEISEGFPRLTRANISTEIRRVRYEIDLDLVSTRDVQLEHALRQLGVI